MHCDPPSTDAAWLDGYEAAIGDALGVIDSVSGERFGNLTSPVLMHLRARIQALRSGQRRGVA